MTPGRCRRPCTWQPPSPGAPASRLEQALANTSGQGRAALAAYVPAGYPTLDRSLDVLHLRATTADVIEIGLPYTDPLMDGPVIQRAAEQALRAGFRTEHLFTTVRSSPRPPAPRPSS